MSKFENAFISVNYYSEHKNFVAKRWRGSVTSLLISKRAEGIEIGRYCGLQKGFLVHPSRPILIGPDQIHELSKFCFSLQSLFCNNGIFNDKENADLTANLSSEVAGNLSIITNEIFPSAHLENSQQQEELNNNQGSTNAGEDFPREEDQISSLQNVSITGKGSTNVGENFLPNGGQNSGLRVDLIRVQGATDMKENFPSRNMHPSDLLKDLNSSFNSMELGKYVPPNNGEISMSDNDESGINGLPKLNEKFPRREDQSVLTGDSSKGIACKCKSSKTEKRKNWIVINYKCNHSSFNGYRFSLSNYSEIKCTRCNCQWRTKQPYVEHLPREEKASESI